MTDTVINPTKDCVILALSSECKRLKDLNTKLCADFNLMNQHGAKQDAALTNSRAETAAAYERAARVAEVSEAQLYHSRLCAARIRAIATVSIIRSRLSGGNPHISSSELTKPKSNPALCATSLVSSPRNSSSSATRSWNRGLSDRKLIESPWTASAAAGMSRSGLK